MCRMQCVLALLTLYVGLVHSWDIAVSLGDKLQFYTNEKKLYTVEFKFRNLNALVYDAAHNMILFVDKQEDNDAICGYHLFFEDVRCFVKRYGSNIHDLAVDPATEKLFFTDTEERSINWISLKHHRSLEKWDNVHGKLLIKMDDRTPSDVAVDSCRGYIYWTNSNLGKTKVYIERARLNGSERQPIYTYSPVHTFAIDPKTQTNYLVTGFYSDFHQKVDLRQKYLNAEHFEFIFYNADVSAQELTVSKDYVYWMNSSESHKTIWRLLKNASSDSVEIKEISRFYTKYQLGIATNYRIKQQVQGLRDCETLSNLIPTTTITEPTADTGGSTELYEATETDQTTEADWSTEKTTELDETTKTEKTTKLDETTGTEQISDIYETTETVQIVETDGTAETDQADETEVDPNCRYDAGYSGKRYKFHVCHGYCLNNGDCSLNEKSEPVCQCKGDYVDARCEVSGCLNYCFQGSCSLNDEGHPECRCNAGYSGARCEVYACQSYCLNNGDCSLNEEDEPICQCVGNHEGSRCEGVTYVKNHTVTYIPQNYSGKGNLTLADLLSNWRKPTAKVAIVVEV